MARRPFPEASRLWKLKPVYLDTESTGLSNRDQIIEIAIIDHDGCVLIDTLVKPTVPISSGAMRIHGITEAHLAGAPPFAEIWPNISLILLRRPVVIYNQSFDLRLLRQSATEYGIHFSSPQSTHCAMALYRAFHGRSSLANAAVSCGLSVPGKLHRAAADAELTRRLVCHMAGV